MSPVPRWEMVDNAMAAILRQKTEAERLAIAGEIWRIARQVVRDRIEAEHVDWTVEQIQRETTRRISISPVDIDDRRLLEAILFASDTPLVVAANRAVD